LRFMPQLIDLNHHGPVKPTFNLSNNNLMSYNVNQYSSSVDSTLTLTSNFVSTVRSPEP